MQALRRHLGPEAAAKLDQLAAHRARIAGATLRGAGSAAELADLEAQAQALEAALAGESAEFRAVARAVTVDEVQRALPAGAALVEVVSYPPFDPGLPRL